MNQWHAEDLRYHRHSSRETRMRIDKNSRSLKNPYANGCNQGKEYLLSLGIHGEIVSMGILSCF